MAEFSINSLHRAPRYGTIGANNATAGNTSPLERGYTYLEMIASKRRNKLLPENLETLFLLAALKIPTKKADMYTKEVDHLNGKSY